MRSGFSAYFWCYHFSQETGPLLQVRTTEGEISPIQLHQKNRRARFVAKPSSFRLSFALPLHLLPLPEPCSQPEGTPPPGQIDPEGAVGSTGTLEQHCASSARPYHG